MSQDDVYGVLYMIRNTVNGKVYIGQTINLYSFRCGQHFSYLKRNVHINSHLQSAVNKYGISSFITGSIAECFSKNELDATETSCINFYNSMNPDKGYNKTSGGSTGSPSQETRKKIGNGHRGKTISSEHKRSLSESAKKRCGDLNGFFGKTHSPESIEKNRLAHLGKKQTEESNRKRSASLRRYYEERRNNGVV